MRRLLNKILFRLSLYLDFSEPEPHARMIFEAMKKRGVRMSYWRRKLLNRTVKQLKKDGLWAKFDVLCLPLPGEPKFIKINWINPDQTINL